MSPSSTLVQHKNVMTIACLHNCLISDIPWEFATNQACRKKQHCLTSSAIIGLGRKKAPKLNCRFCCSFDSTMCCYCMVENTFLCLAYVRYFVIMIKFVHVLALASNFIPIRSLQFVGVLFVAFQNLQMIEFEYLKKLCLLMCVAFGVCWWYSG